MSATADPSQGDAPVDMDGPAAKSGGRRPSGPTHEKYPARGLIDCLILAVAWRTSAALLAYDVDLCRIAGIVGIEVDPASHCA